MDILKLWESLPPQVRNAYERVVDRRYDIACKLAMEYNIQISSCGIDLTTRAGKVKITTAILRYVERIRNAS